MDKACNLVHGLKPVLVMTVVQFAYAGLNVLYKLATNDGMSLKVMVAYRYTFAAAFMVPIALIFERKRPKLTWAILFQAFLCGLFAGSLAQILYVTSLVLTSVTFVAAMTNTIPAITFVLAVFVGMEKLRIRSLTGQARVLGTLMGIGGAMVLTYYRGPKIQLWSTHVDLLHHGERHLASAHGYSALGSSLVVASSISFAIWLIVQAKMSASYPCPYSSTALMSVMGSIQAVVYALCTEKDWSQWRLGWNIRLLTVAYAGVVASGLMMTFITWCVRKRGPVFVSVFSPLLLLLVAIFGSLFLNETLHLGSIIGAVLIVIGLYAVLWGNSKELKIKRSQLAASKSSGEAENIEIIATYPQEGNSSSSHNNNFSDISINMSENDQLQKEHHNDATKERATEEGKGELSKN